MAGVHGGDSATGMGVKTHLGVKTHMGKGRGEARLLGGGAARQELGRLHWARLSLEQPVKTPRRGEDARPHCDKVGREEARGGQRRQAAHAGPLRQVVAAAHPSPDDPRERDIRPRSACRWFPSPTRRSSSRSPRTGRPLLACAPIQGKHTSRRASKGLLQRCR